MLSNGQLLLFLCSEYGPSITNTILQSAQPRKTSWRHPCSNHYHLIDYVVVKCFTGKDVKMARSFSIGECWFNHNLIRLKISLTIRSPVRNNRTPLFQRVGDKKLTNVDNFKSFQTLCDSKLSDIPNNADIESTWFVFKIAVYELSQKTLGYVKTSLT